MIKKFTKFLLASALLLSGATAMAQIEVPKPSTIPNGTMNVDQYPEGVNAVEFSGKWTINRDAKGYISLYRDDLLIRQIPASNEQMFYTYVQDVFDVTRKDNAPFRVDFWYTTNSPAGLPGVYKIVIPAGFMYYDGNKEAVNPEWEFTITCIGEDKSSITILPEPNKMYTSLETFTIELPDLVNYRFTKPTARVEDFYFDDKANECTVEIKDNVAVFTPSKPLTQASTYQFIAAGYERKKMVDGVETWVVGDTIRATYQLTHSIGNTSIEPKDNEKYDFFPAQPVMLPGTAGNFSEKYALFTLNLENPLMYVLMGRPLWCPVMEDGTPDTSNGTQLAIGSNLTGEDSEYPGDRKKLYVLTPDSEQSDLMPSEGKYALVFPAGKCFSMKAEDGSSYNNPELVFYYEVGANDKFPVTLKPVNGQRVKSLQYFTVTFDEGVEIACTNNAFAQLSNGIAVFAMRGKLTEGLTNEIHFDLPIPMEEKGIWVFTTPSSGFTANGNAISCSGTYTVTDDIEPVDKTCVVLPAAGEVTELSEFRISFPSYDGLFGREGGGGITLTRLPDTDVALESGYYDEAAKCFLLPLTEATKTPGEYTLHILPDTFWVGLEDGFVNDDIVVKYTIKDDSESVDAISIDELRGDVFNAAGILVLRDADIEAVRALDKGLYIFAGRKIIVR